MNNRTVQFQKDNKFCERVPGHYQQFLLILLERCSSCMMFKVLLFWRLKEIAVLEPVYCVLARLTPLSNNLLYLEIKIPGLSFYFLKHPTWRIYIIFCYTGLPKRESRAVDFPEFSRSVLQSYSPDHLCQALLFY